MRTLGNYYFFIDALPHQWGRAWLSGPVTYCPSISWSCCPTFPVRQGDITILTQNNHHLLRGTSKHIPLRLAKKCVLVCIKNLSHAYEMSPVHKIIPEFLLNRASNVLLNIIRKSAKEITISLQYYRCSEWIDMDECKGCNRGLESIRTASFSLPLQILTNWFCLAPVIKECFK